MKDMGISDDQLLDYLDGILDQHERSRIESALSSNAALTKRYAELKAVHGYLKQLDTVEPSKNFTQVVMGKLDQYPLRKGFSFFNTILLLVGVLTAVAIATLLVSNGYFDGSTSVDLNTVKIPKLEHQPLPSLTINGKWMVNIIIVLNLAIAFVVLDRMILKPLFKNRLQSSH